MPQEHGDISARSSEEVFLESLERNQDIDIDRAEESTENQDTTLQTVAMLSDERGANRTLREGIRHE